MTTIRVKNIVSETIYHKTLETQQDARDIMKILTAGMNNNLELDVTVNWWRPKRESDEPCFSLAELQRRVLTNS